jgi:hypothetical protein
MDWVGAGVWIGWILLGEWSAQALLSWLGGVGTSGIDEGNDLEAGMVH